MYVLVSVFVCVVRVCKYVSSCVLLGMCVQFTCAPLAGRVDGERPAFSNDVVQQLTPRAMDSANGRQEVSTDSCVHTHRLTGEGQSG